MEHISTLLALLSLAAEALILLLLISAIWPSGAPWLPTPPAKVRHMLELADVQPGEVVYDLGSGDGRMLVVAARRFGARAVGIEIDPLRLLVSRALVAVTGVRKQARVIWGSFFKANLSAADVVTCYLLAKTNAQIVGKLHDELRPGARVVSYIFPFPDWEVDFHDAGAGIFLYTIGSGRAGPDEAVR